MDMWACIHEKVRGQPQISLFRNCPLFFETASSLAQASQSRPHQLAVSPRFILWDQKPGPPHLARVFQVLGLELKSLSLQDKCLTDQSTPPPDSRELMASFYFLLCSLSFDFTHPKHFQISKSHIRKIPDAPGQPPTQSFPPETNGCLYSLHSALFSWMPCFPLNHTSFTEILT